MVWNTSVTQSQYDKKGDMETLMNLEENKEVMTLIIDGKEHYIKLQGTTEKPYFCGKDVCKVLGYADGKSNSSTVTLHTIVKPKHKCMLKELLKTSFTNPDSQTSLVRLGADTTNVGYHDGKAIYISEAGLYMLIMHSRVAFAQAFQDLVVEKILPSIRKFGSYHANNQIMQMKQQLEIKDAETQKQLAIKDAEVLQERKDKEAALLLAEKERKGKEAAQAYSTILKDMLVSNEPIQKNQCVYISTSASYAKQNRFKVGGVESSALLTKRLSTYNSNRTVGDEWYFTNIFQVVDYRNIEQRLNILVGRFRDKSSKEVYRMHYNNISYIVTYLCERFDDDVDDINAQLEEFISNLDTTKQCPVIPPPATVKLITTTDLPSGRQTTTIEQQLKSFLTTLPSEKKEISRKEVFDAIKLRTGRTRAYSILEELIIKLVPDLTLLKQQRR